jgi:hypothetical protein
MANQQKPHLHYSSILDETPTDLLSRKRAQLFLSIKAASEMIAENVNEEYGFALSETCYEFEDALNIYISSKGDKL